MQTTKINTLSLHDALPILDKYLIKALDDFEKNKGKYAKRDKSKLKQKEKLPDWAKDDTAQKNILTEKGIQRSKEIEDRKSTRLNSSHVSISYAVFCLKKKK